MVISIVNEYDLFRNLLSDSLNLRHVQEQSIIYFTSTVVGLEFPNISTSPIFHQNALNCFRLKIVANNHDNGFHVRRTYWYHHLLLDKRYTFLKKNVFTLFLDFAVDEFCLSPDLNNWRLFFLILSLNGLSILRRCDSQKSHTVPFPWPLLL